MRFSPLLVSSLIVNPLRYFFANYSGQLGLTWNADEKISTIEIGTVNDYNKIALESRPRIMVNRGTYRISKTGLTDSMAESPDIYKAMGKSERTNLVFIDGVAQIIIEARNEGTCELITDMVSHFIVWARPLLCDTQGFNEFGMGMQVSDCMPAGVENTEKFQVAISFPYRMEEDWMVKQDSLKLKGFFTTLQNAT
jgi:hypothetical protein